MFFYLESFVHKSIVISFLPPNCITHTVAMLLQNYRTLYDPPLTSPLYAIHHTTLAITISCKGQSMATMTEGRCLSVRRIAERQVSSHAVHLNIVFLLEGLTQSVPFVKGALQRVNWRKPPFALPAALVAVKLGVKVRVTWTPLTKRTDNWRKPHIYIYIYRDWSLT